MFKFKNLFKKALAITCALAILVCGVPMVASAEETAEISNGLEDYGKVITESTVLKDGSVSATFSSSYGNPAWQNNTFINGLTTNDLTGYDTITFTFTIANQAEYDLWKYHTAFVINQGAGGVRYPMPTDLVEGDNTITLDLAMLKGHGVDITNIQNVFVDSVYNGSWYNGNVNSAAGSNSHNCGWFGSGDVDFTFTVSNVTANKVSYPRTVERLPIGYYGQYGDQCGNFNWANFLAQLPTAVNISYGDYLEFDIYISDAESLKAEALSDGSAVWSSFNMRFTNSAGAYIHIPYSASSLNTGYNHIKVPVSQLGSFASDLKSIEVYQESNGAIYTPSKNYMLGIDNFAVTREEKNVAPEMNNTYYNPSYTLEDIVIKRSYTSGQSFMDWNLGWPGIFYCDFTGNVDDGLKIDASKAEYLEFDIYASAAVSPEGMIMTSGSGEGAGRRGIGSPFTLTAGWNHIAIPMSSFGAYGQYETADTPYDTSALSAMYFMGKASADVDYRIANIAFTTSAPAIEDTLLHCDPVFKNDSIIFNTTVASGTTWDAIGMWPYINNGAAVDASTADYIELDVYSSTTLAGGGGFWLTSTHGTGSGRRRVDLPALKEGWNHIAFKLSDFHYNAGGEWAELYDQSSLKGIFFELTPVAADGVTAAITLKVANLAFTKNPVMNNEYNNVVYAANNGGIFMERNYVTGQSALDWTYGWGGVFIEEIVGDSSTIEDAVDVSAAEYVEFDFFVSEDTANNFKVWLSSNVSSESGRRRTIIPAQTKGWHHIVLPLNTDTFNVTAGEWNLAALKTLFLEFSSTPADSSVTSTQYKIANLAFTSDIYTVTWADEDGTVIETDTVAAGAIPEYNSATPSKAADSKFIYEFAGWDKDIVAVTGDVTYTAVYTATPYVAGDATGDETINMLDLVAAKNNLLAEEVVYSVSLDLDLDGDVDSADYTALRKVIWDMF